MIAQNVQRNIQLGFQRYTSLINQALQWIVFIYQAIAVVIFLLGIFWATSWFQQPFIGAFYEHTMVFNGTGPSDPDPNKLAFRQLFA